jgi:hypothetical protein
VIWIDYLGVGVSEGKSDLKVPGIQNDALAILDTVKNNLLANNPRALNGI